MRKWILLLAALFLAPIFALAEPGVALDETAVVADMPCSWAQGYEPRIEGNILILDVPIRADGMNKVTVTLCTDDKTISPLKNQRTSATAYRNSSGLHMATLKVSLIKGRINGDYPVKLAITGATASGDTVTCEYPFILHIRDGKAIEEKPRPVITDVSALLKVGEDSTLFATLTNASPYADMTGVTLKISDTSGDILPTGTDTIVLPDIPAGSSTNIAVPVTVRSTASVSLHTLRFDLSWTALDAAATWQETFTLPVSQEIRLEQGGIALSPTILQGELATLTLPLMNMGRGELRNVMVTLELPGITDRQSVLVGTIPSGETKQARLTFTPGKAIEGFFTGIATVSAEDAYGNDTSFVLPVETTVEKAPELNVTIQAQDEQHDTWWLTLALAVGCGVLMIACILQGMILRRKIRRLEEARL